MIFQNSAENCGYACIAMLLSYYGKKATINQVKMAYPHANSALTAHDICSIANLYGLKLKVFYTQNISTVLTKRPRILHWNNCHYVIAYRYKKNHIKIYDPENGIKIITYQELANHFTGFMFEVDAVKGNNTHDFLATSRIKKAASFLPLIVLIMLAQLLLFGSPILIQKIIDLLGDEANFTMPMCFMFAYILAKSAEAIFEYIKIVTLSKYGYVFNSKLAKKVVSKLNKLPIEWYTKKQVGEVFNTVASVYKLNAIYVDNIVGAIADGVIAVLMAVILSLVSPIIFLMIICAIIAEATAYKIFIRKIRYFINYGIKQKSASDQILLENIRSILSSKINLLSHLRGLLWQKKFREYGRISRKISRYKGIYQLIRSNIINIETLIIVIISAMSIKNAKLTYGGFYLLLFYKSYIHEAVKRMFDKCFDYEFVEEHISNVKCIINENDDHSINSDLNFKQPQNKISAVNIDFCYLNSSHLILENFSYDFVMGKSYCIVGPSGCGKTTLLYLLMGIMQPTNGYFQVDGSQHGSLNNKIYQSSIASVLQNDHLFSASILENVTLFDKNPDLKLFKEVCEIAHIDQYVNNLSLTYNSFIDGSCNNMSGGQKQRILLARALYKKPKILFLDEASSHLDKKTESIINCNIAELKISKIIVAHRLETLRFCDHLVDLGRGGDASEHNIQAEMLSKHSNYNKISRNLYHQQNCIINSTAQTH
jgi:ATP-binding cassette subfamily B protein RaxB